VNPPRPAAPEPHFIDGPHGPLFAVFYPAQGVAGEGTPGVLVLPPFAEELNRSRRMMALLGRALSARGVAVLVLDLFGTGDSGGEFSDGRWDIWRADAEAARSWLARRATGGLSLLGLRLGACLAPELAKGGEAPARVVMWNPVLRGDLMLNQFLRVRALAGIAQEGTGGETAKELRARLSAGETLEVAGYALHPELADALETLRLAQLAEGCPAPIDWFEVASEAGSPPPPASAAAIEALRAASVRVAYQSIPGEPFWNIEETVVVEPLLAATAALWPT